MRKTSMIARRFNCFYSVDELYKTNVEMLNLAYCKLQKGGYLIMKTMDFVYGTKQYWVSNFVQDKAACNRALYWKIHLFLCQSTRFYPQK